MRAGDPARDLARAIARRGLAAPARLLLDVHRPLDPLIGDAAVALGPLFGQLLGRRHAVTRLAVEPDAFWRLLAALEAEEGAATEDECPRPPS